MILREFEMWLRGLLRPAPLHLDVFSAPLLHWPL